MKVRSIWIESEHCADRPDVRDDNTDVRVTLDDGSNWVATFFSYQNILTLAAKNRMTGECLSGRYFWAKEMILVDEVSRKLIEEVVTHLVQNEPLEFEQSFQRADEMPRLA